MSNCIRYTELAELCHKLNCSTSKQHRPGHQLVKLYNVLLRLSSEEEFYKGEDNFDELIQKLELEHMMKHSHAFVVKSYLVVAAKLSKEEQTTKLAEFAKKLDDHEKWEYESRRRNKSRRKTSREKVSVKDLSRPTSCESLCGLSSSHGSTSTLNSASSYGSFSRMEESFGESRFDYSPYHRPSVPHHDASPALNSSQSVHKTSIRPVSPMLGPNERQQYERQLAELQRENYLLKRRTSDVDLLKNNLKERFFKTKHDSYDGYQYEPLYENDYFKDYDFASEAAKAFPFDEKYGPDFYYGENMETYMTRRARSRKEERDITIWNSAENHLSPYIY